MDLVILECNWQEKEIDPQWHLEPVVVVVFLWVKSVSQPGLGDDVW